MTCLPRLQAGLDLPDSHCDEIPYDDGDGISTEPDPVPEWLLRRPIPQRSNQTETAGDTRLGASQEETGHHEPGEIGRGGMASQNNSP
jgi:hypothetical protein